MILPPIKSIPHLVFISHSQVDDNISVVCAEGMWSDWSDCTASCGGGVSVRSIKCYDTLYGRIVDPCREFHVSCNSVPCPEG